MASSSEYNNSVSIISECTIVPDDDSDSSSIESLQLSASDLPMLTFQYIQKGCLFSGKPPNSLVSLLKSSLSKALSIFPPLAGRLSTDSATGRVSIACSGVGALFVHARASSLRLDNILDPAKEGDVPMIFRRFFALNDTLGYDGHWKPITAVQVTELADSVFIGCSVNHAVVDGTTFWNFFNTLAEICRGATESSLRPPCFSRDESVFSTDTVIRFPDNRSESTFSADESVRERIFHFSHQSISALKKRANESRSDEISISISSFQSLCALVWRSVTRARKLDPSKTTSFVFPVNCRRRVKPEMEASYFGNAIQIVRTEALAGELVSREMGWSADLLHRTVRAHDDRTVREGVEAWERDPRCFQLGNLDGATVIVGSSPRFPMYDNDFGWGRPVAVRSGGANKFDGNFSVFPGWEGGGSVDLEVVLTPETMAALERDDEFMQYVNCGFNASSSF